MSPNPIQPASPASASEISNLRSAISSSFSSSISDQIVRAIQRQLAAKTAKLDAADESLPTIFDNYAMSMHMATLERIFAILEKFPVGTEGQPEHIKVLRMMLQALSAYQRAMSRRAREQSAQRREQAQQVKAQAKQVKEAKQREDVEAARTRAHAIFQNFQNLVQPEITRAVETESKDATPTAKSENAQPTSSIPLSTSAPLPLPQVATVPAKNEKLAPAPALTS